MTTTDMSASNESPLATDGGASPKRKVVIGVAAVILITLFWIFTFWWGSNHGNPDYLPDRAWATAANNTCKTYQAQIARLPRAEDFQKVLKDQGRAIAMKQRADVAGQITAILRAEQAALRANPLPPTPKSALAITLWYKDWDIHLADRDRHVAKLEAGIDAQFAETADNKGEPTALRLNQFANFNFPACAAPSDLG